MEGKIHAIDKFIRLAISIFLFTLMLLSDDDPLLALISGIIGFYLVVTAALGICAIYLFLGISTGKTHKPKY